jgi:hypothetical protein
VRQVEGYVAAEKRQTMNQAMIGSLALMLSLSIWPARQTLAAIDSRHQSALGATLQVTDEQAALRLAKHQDDDGNQEQENEDKHHHKHGRHHASGDEQLMASAVLRAVLQVELCAVFSRLLLAERLHQPAARIA